MPNYEYPDKGYRIVFTRLFYDTFDAEVPMFSC